MQRLFFSERDGVEGASLFVDLVVSYYSFTFEVLEDCYHKFPYATFNFQMSVFEPTLFEYISKCYCQCHLLMPYALQYSPYDVKLDHDIQRRILLPRDVQQLSIKRKRLMILNASHFPYRRLVLQVYDCGLFAVYCRFPYDFAGQKISGNVRARSVFIIELSANISHDDFDLKTHEFFETVHDSGELVFVGFSFASANFASKPAIDHCRCDVSVTSAIFAYADNQNVAVKLVERFRQREFRVL